MMMATLALLALRAAAPLHVDLAIKPCNKQDPGQAWTMATPMGTGGVLTHQSSGLCLMTENCVVAEGAALVLGDCKTGCLSSHPEAGTFTLHHPGGTSPRALESTKCPYKDGHPSLCASASSTSIGPVVTLQPWDSTSTTHQEWTSAIPYTGPDHAMQVGRL